MRTLMFIEIPNEPFNSLVRKGTAGNLVKKILDSNRPQSAYFTDMDGARGGVLVVDISDPSQIPALAEPWFLSFNATCKFRIAMVPEDLGKSGLDAIGKAW